MFSPPGNWCGRCCDHVSPARDARLPYDSERKHPGRCPSLVCIPRSGPSGLLTTARTLQTKTPLSCQDENSAKQTLGIGCILGRMFMARGPLLSLNTKFIIPVREDLVKQNPPGSGIIFEKRAEPFTTVPRFLGPRRSPASAGSVGRGGARQRVTFSPRGGNRTSGLCADDVTLHLFETRF